ncbi:MAG: DUF192 domain-containing protein [Hyphomicrobiales bacterium]
MSLARRLRQLLVLWFIALPVLALPVIAPSLVEAQTPVKLPEEPLTIETAAGAKHRFTVEVASTREQQETGLMFRTELAPDRGMLFDWSGMYPAAMWMKNTLIPLDMLFIDADGTILDIEENLRPESLDVVSAGVPVRAVLELAGGSAKRLGLKVGDRVRNRIFTAP